MSYQFTRFSEEEKKRIHWSKNHLLRADEEGYNVFKLEHNGAVAYFSTSPENPGISHILFDGDFGENTVPAIIDFVEQMCEPDGCRIIMIHGLTYAQSEHFPEAFKVHGLEPHTGPIGEYAHGGGYVAKRWLPRPGEEVMTWVSKIYEEEKTRYSLLDLGRMFLQAVRS